MSAKKKPTKDAVGGPAPRPCSRLLALRSRVESNDEWIAHAQQLYLREHRLNGQYARDQREASKLSLRTVATRMGVSAMMLCDLERGNRNWTASMLTKWETAMSPENTLL